MARYAFIFRGGAAEVPGLSAGEMQAHLQRWHEWVAALGKAGRKPGGTALDPGGKTMRGRDRVVTDGPYAESKDLVTGSIVIEADSLEHATSFARDCPVFEYGGSVEVRPVAELG